MEYSMHLIQIFVLRNNELMILEQCVVQTLTFNCYILSGVKHKEIRNSYITWKNDDVM
jgi:hypothetical protein